MKRIFLLAFLCLQALAMSADIVTGRVVDADTGEPLEGAKVDFYVKPVGTYGAMLIYMTTDSVGSFKWTVESMSQVSIEVNYFGYNSLKKTFNCAGGTKDTLNIGNLQLKMSDNLLKEVTVEAKARRFVMKGDTVVFNPDAFNLDDGARIAELLEKLPGVTIKDGKLFFMDKVVHLKINGHDVADDFLTGQLPAEAVQNIKAYEKKSELTELTGMNDGQEKQILDIEIKPGFMDKWYGQTKLSAYASKNYRASANLHFLSDKNPISLYVRASDNGSKTGGVYGEYESEWGDTPQRQQYGKFAYRHNWKPEFVKTSYEDYWSIGTSPNHNDVHQKSWENTETFLDGKTSSFTNSQSYNYNHYLEIPLNFDTELHFGPKTSFVLRAEGGARRNTDRTTDEQKTYQGDAYSDAPQHLVNSSEGETLSRADVGYADLQMRLSHALERGDFYVSFSTSYNKSKGTADSHTSYTYDELGKTETLDQTSNTNSNLFQTIFDTKLNYQLVPKKVKVGVGYWVDYWRKADDSEHFQNEEYDFANSFERMKYYLVNEPRFEAEADLDKLWMRAAVKIQNVEEHFDYQRGKLDTLVCRNTWFPRPVFEFKWQSSKTTQLRGSVDWDYHVADLLGGLDYTDDTNPLSIVKGNPDLKASSNLTSNLAYSMMFAKGQQMLSFTLYYNRVFTPASQVRAYDSHTGVYTTTTANIDYRQKMTAGINYDRALGKYFRLRNRTTLSYNTDFGFKTLASLSDPWEVFSQNSTSVYENLNLTYENKGWEASAYGSITYSDVNYSDQTMQGQRLYNYSTGLSGKYRMKHWTFDLKGELVGNAGYLSDMMNRNRLRLDASITWKTLKGKAQLALAARDILNQMDWRYAGFSPNGRFESRTETFHRYLALTFTYNFDAKAKKK